MGGRCWPWEEEAEHRRRAAAREAWKARLRPLRRALPVLGWVAYLLAVWGACVLARG